MNAPPPRNVLRVLFRKFIDSFYSTEKSSRGIYKGEDTFGNKFYEAPPSVQDLKLRRKNKNQPYRWYVGPDEERFDQKFLSAEWDAWLRGRRDNTPTMEELIKNEQIAAMKKINASKLAEKEGVVSEPKSLEPKEQPKDQFPVYEDIHIEGRGKGISYPQEPVLKKY